MRRGAPEAIVLAGVVAVGVVVYVVGRPDPAPPDGDAAFILETCQQLTVGVDGSVDECVSGFRQGLADRDGPLAETQLNTRTSGRPATYRVGYVRGLDEAQARGY